MPPPRANLGGPFGGGTIAPTNQIDIAGAIGAVSQGASSLLHNAYIRKIAQANQAMAQRKADLEQQNVQSEIEDREQRRTLEQRKHELDVVRAAHDFMEKGGVPAHDTTVPSGAITAAGMSAAPGTAGPAAV